MTFARYPTRPLLGFVLAFLVACRGDREQDQAGARNGQQTVAPSPAFTPVTHQMLDALESAGEDWATHGGAYNNQRFSVLDQINRETIGELVPVWIHQTGLSESFTTTPLVVGNTMYLSTPESQVVALNASTGQRLWRFTPALRPTMLCCGPDNRGLAALGDRVFVATLDARLIALNNRSGEIVWETQVADPAEGYSQTMAPLAVGNLIVVGIGGAEFGVRGFMSALDADTGEEVWRWYTVASPEDAPNGWFGDWRETDPFGTGLGRDIANEQRNSERYQEGWRRGGGAVSTTPAYDPGTQTLFVVVGSPAPSLDGAVRPGDNLYTGSLVALDAATGTPRWHFQYLPHDVWDLSGGSPPFLLSSQGRRFVAHAGKAGWVYIVDAGTGTPLLRSDNFVAQENLFERPTEAGIRMLPGANGGSGWSPVSFSPRTGLAYVSGMHQPMLYSRAFQPREQGRIWTGGSFRHIPEENQWGILSAIDMASGEIRWQRQTPTPLLGGTLATAGDLVFVGQGTGSFEAFDAETGSLLWNFETGAGVHGTPITYRVNGVQYVAVASGGNFELDTPRGDDLIVFALYTKHRRPPLAAYPEPRYPRGGSMRYGAARQVPAAEVEQMRQRGATTQPR